MDDANILSSINWPANRQAGQLSQMAGEKLRTAREAIQDSQFGRMNKYEQLKKLGELKDKGVLIDEEFQAEKVRILGQ